MFWGTSGQACHLGPTFTETSGEEKNPVWGQELQEPNTELVSDSHLVSHLLTVSPECSPPEG